MEKKSVFKICLTGGPCSGKTTALAKIKEHFSKNFEVITIPEVAATAIIAGVKLIPDQLTLEQSLLINTNMCQLQIDLENFFEDTAAKTKKDVLIVCDRGVCDNFAYITPENKEKILNSKGWNYNFVSHERYDLVIHLVTAAIGAEKFYTLENNEARSESAEIAAMIDRRLREQWETHPRFEVVDNSHGGGFEAKIQRVTKAISDLIGAPGIPLSTEYNKFLLQEFDPETLSTHTKFNFFDENIDYLVSSRPDQIHWVVKRTEGDSKLFPVYTYVLRILSDDPEKRIEKRKIISEKIYLDFIKQKNKNIPTVHRSTQSFFNEKDKAVFMFNIETTKIGPKTSHVLRTTAPKEQIPEFLKAEGNISNNPDYMTYKLATN